MRLPHHTAPHPQHTTPTPHHITPRGSVVAEHVNVMRNMAGKSCWKHSMVSQYKTHTTNSCKHSDLHYLQADYRQPYVRGTGDPLKTALEGTLFNNRKTSGVFNSGGCLCLCLCTAACLGNSLAILHSTADGVKGCLLTQPSAAVLHASVFAGQPGHFSVYSTLILSCMHRTMSHDSPASELVSCTHHSCVKDALAPGN